MESVFTFVDYSWESSRKTLELHYKVGEIPMTETWIFEHSIDEKYSKDALDRAAFALWVMCGVSYWKATTANKILFESGGLTPNQADFFRTVWQRGLGEFFYVNQLDPAQMIPLTASLQSAPAPISNLNLSGALVPLGGGKDSLTTVALLQQSDQSFSTWTINATQILQPQIDIINKPHLPVKRVIDQKLIHLNKKGALNGHVPMSAIYGLAAVFSAILCNNKYVILSNEHSANFGNFVYKGIEINHQWSKSLNFEKKLQMYIKNYITTDIQYFSFLRPLSEYSIARLFSHHCWDTYKDVFTSCNKNFRLTNNSPISWCGACPKCCFIAAILSPFITLEESKKLFNKDIFTDKKNTKTFLQLMGVENMKPLECVGEPDEVCFALKNADSSYDMNALFDIPAVDFNDASFAENAMPNKFLDLLKNAL